MTFKNTNDEKKAAKQWPSNIYKLNGLTFNFFFNENL